MVRPSKKKQIPNLQDAIKDTAWKQIAEFGAPALSLRAIARELKITAPAIYNYFPDRDALVTALIVDAFMSFGDWQIEARDAVPADDHAGRLRAIGMAYRNWAHAYPQRYQLIFGTPIPGYQPAPEELLPSSTRSIGALFSVVEGIRAAGKLPDVPFAEVKLAYTGQYEMWKMHMGDVRLVTVFVVMTIWARVHGIVSLEVQGNLPLFGEDGDALYSAELDSIVRQFIAE